MQHKIIKNKIYSTNRDDVELCLIIALNTSVLYTITGLDVYNYKKRKLMK